MNEKVSVIIPVYNVEDYLTRCLMSVVNQTFKDLEIILINDGSTDGSGELCRRWKEKDNRIILIEQENKGLGPARNVGIRAASSEYILFIDSDDWWELNTVETLHRAAKENDADIIYMNFYFSELDHDTGKLKERPFVQYCLFDGVTNADEMPELIFSSDARMWSKMFRRKLFVDNHIYMPAHPFEDFPVLPLLILKARRICQVNQLLYHYFFKRDNNLTGKLDNCKYISTGVRELYQAFQKNGYIEKYGERLSKYIYAMCKNTIADARVQRLKRKEYEKFVRPFWDALEVLCPERLMLKDKKIALCGSRTGKLICMNFAFAEQLTVEYNISSTEAFHVLLHELSAFKDCDYIFIDLLEMLCGADTEKENILRTLQQFGKELKQTVLAKKVVLLKLYLAEQYGEHIKDCQYYANIENIRKKNDLLRECYQFLEQETGQAFHAVIDFTEFDNYTYIHTASGCLPQYCNGRFHSKAAEKLERVLIKLQDF